jgi:HEAT repeat protein
MSTLAQPHDSRVERVIEALQRFAPELLPDDLAGREPTKFASHDIPQLILAAEREIDEGIRALVIDTLADRIDEAGATPDVRAFLWETMRKATSRVLRSTTAKALAVARDEVFLGKVRSSLATANLVDLRLAALMIGFAKDAESLPRLLELLSLERLAACDAIIWAIGEIGSSEALPILHSFLAMHIFSVEAAQAIGAIGDPLSIVPLLEAVMFDDPALHAAAMQALVRIIHRLGDASTLEAEIIGAITSVLDHLIDRAGTPIARYYALVAYGLLGGQLHPNRIMAALGAVLPKEQMSKMSAFFVGRSKAAP